MLTAANSTLETVCSRFGVPPHFLRLRVKDRAHARCRAVAALVLRRKFDMTYREIGELLGGMNEGATATCATRGRSMACREPEVGAFVAAVLRERTAA